MSKKIFILLLVLCAVKSIAQIPLFRLQQSEDWGAINAKTIYQDSKGWFWIGGQRSVYRYDGIDYECFTLSDSIQGNAAVSAIFERKDTLWIGFDDGTIGLLTFPANYKTTHSKHTGVVENQKGSISIWQPEEGTPTKPITGFANDLNGYLWISTYGEGLYVWTGSRLFQFNYEDEHLSSDEIYTMLCDNDGHIWAATDNGISIANFSKDHIKTVHTIGLKDGLPDEIVTVLHKDKKGNIWIGTHDKGICLYRSDKKTFTLVLGQWNFGEVLDFVVFEDYEIWASTTDGGLLQCNTKGLCQQVPAPAKIRQIERDREGQLWLMSEQGAIYSANLGVMRTPTPFTNVQAICSDAQGSIWAGNSEGLFVRKNNTWATVGQRNNVISLVAAPDNKIWAGHFGNGIGVYNNNGRLEKEITTANGLPDGSILSMAVAGTKIWVATLGGIVVVDQHTYAVTDVEKMSGNPLVRKLYVYKIHCDSKGRVWCCTDGHGICMWDGTTLHHWQEANGIPFKTIYSVAEDHHGAIWFSGEQTNLWSFDGQQFKQYTAREHLHKPQISSLATTGSGQLVIGYNDGVDILTPETGHILFLSENAGIALSEASLNAACPDPSGHVWLGTANGVSRISGYAQTFFTDPATLIKSVSNLSRNIDFYKENIFAHDENHLVFEYAGIWLSNPSSVYYRYKLDGFDPDWTVSKDRIASYPNLPPGKYCFKVQSSEHGYFDNTQEATYVFVVQKPFWTEWWFIMIGIALLAALIRTYITHREKQLRQVQEMENEKIIAQLDVLKTQISPHFLFNSFNTLITIIEENPKMAVDYVQHLADFYRSIMVYREKSYIPLAEELSIVNNFGFLLKRRFEEALQIRINIPEPTGQIMPLTLQLLLENAVKHNVISKKYPLQIEIFMEKKGVIVIKNNKNLKIKPEPGTRFGLQSLAQRYAMVTGKQVEVVQEDGFFIVKIPLIND